MTTAFPNSDLNKEIRFPAWQYGLLRVLFLVFSLCYCLFFILLPIVLLFTPMLTLTIYLMPLFLGALQLLWALRPRKEARQQGFVLTDQGWQDCFSTLSGALEARMPSEIWLVAIDNAYAFQRHGKEIVAIGMPLLVMMNKQELQAVICHELAHHLKGDTHVMPNAKRLELLLERALFSVRGRTGLILMGPYRLFYHFFCRHIYAVFHRHEYVADRQPRLWEPMPWLAVWLNYLSILNVGSISVVPG